MSTIPGLLVLGEANFSDHGANRLGASALMQGLADGYFILPYTIGDYLASDEARRRWRRTSPRCAAAERDVEERTQRLLGDQGQAHRSQSFHRELGQDHVGQLRHGARRARGSSEALQQIPALREEFWANVSVPGQRRRAQPVARAARAASPTSSSSAS